MEENKEYENYAPMTFNDDSTGGEMRKYPEFNYEEFKANKKDDSIAIKENPNHPKVQFSQNISEWT